MPENAFFIGSKERAVSFRQGTRLLLRRCCIQNIKVAVFVGYSYSLIMAKTRTGSKRNLRCAREMTFVLLWNVAAAKTRLRQD